MVKIQNGPIGAKIVPIICASFALASHVIFFICATPLNERGAKLPLHMVKIRNGPIGTKVVSIICAGELCDFFRLCYSPTPQGVKTPCTCGENSKWSDCCENGVNRLCFVCAGELFYFFHLCHPFHSETGCQNLSYIYGENSKWYDWCENSVNRLSFVCAGRICDFLLLYYSCASPTKKVKIRRICGEN